jgi:hypothetical protein
VASPVVRAWAVGAVGARRSLGSRPSRRSTRSS